MQEKNSILLFFFNLENSGKDYLEFVVSVVISIF